MLRRGNFGRAVKWPTMVVKVGLPVGFHFHDLRHTGNQLAANAGATSRELMHRMGHGSQRAALIYQHATTERDRQIADAIGKLVERSRAGVVPEDQQDGDDGAADDGLDPVASQHVDSTNGDDRHPHDRERRPFPLVSGLERATGIEPA